MHEGLWVNFVQRVSLEVELHQLGALLQEAGARDGRDPVLAEEPEKESNKTYCSLSSYSSFSDKAN